MGQSKRKEHCEWGGVGGDGVGVGEFIMWTIQAGAFVSHVGVGSKGPSQVKEA